MHICQDEILALEALVASIPFVGYGIARLKARIASRSTRCPDRPACDGHAHEEPASPAEAPVKAE